MERIREALEEKIPAGQEYIMRGDLIREQFRGRYTCPPREMRRSLLQP